MELGKRRDGSRRAWSLNDTLMWWEIKMAKSKWVGGRIDNFLVIEGPTMFTKLLFALPLLNVNVAVLNGPP
jgi:hypothetical protein